MNKHTATTQTDYIVMSNYHLLDCNLSLKAKGLLTVMLSLPKDWNYSISALCDKCKESENAIQTALKELKERGYLTVTRINPTLENGGIIQYQYIVNEVPYTTIRNCSDSTLVIHHWMHEQLGLIGNELITYAILHKGSNSGTNMFKITHKELSDLVGISEEGIRLVLNSLLNKNLITKYRDNTDMYYQTIGVPDNAEKGWITTSKKSITKSHVYLLKCDRRYKIGVSRNVVNRIKQLDTRPYPLELVTHSAPIANAYDVEKQLHEKYHSVRVANEWFDLSDAQASDVASYLQSLV